MNFHEERAHIHVPDGIEIDDALKRCTHLAVGAHQDDLEIMAFHGILECYEQQDKWFVGVTCTNGSGGPRKEKFASLSELEISEQRNKEQNDAADMGQYAAQIQFNFASSDIKKSGKEEYVADLLKVLHAMQPEVVYTHNPADKHDTHVGVMVGLIQAIRQLPKDKRPKKLYGCEVWRDLDWMEDSDKVRLNVTGHDRLAMNLINCFDSQVTNAKRYDLATLGRRRANATYSDAHSNSIEEQVTYAMDLTSMIRDDSLSLTQLTEQHLKIFQDKVKQTLTTQWGE